jgi:hypothetical protein
MTQKKTRNATWKMEEVCIADIDVASYQRELNEKRAGDISADWDEFQFNPPKLSLRGGTYYVVDGQHTVAGARIKYGANHRLWSRVFSGMTYEQEACAFARQKRHSRSLSAMNTFNSELEGKDPNAQKIDKIVRSLGMQIDVKMGGGDKKLRAIKAIRDAENKHGNLKDTLTILGIWMDGSQAVYSPKLIASVSLFLHVYGDNVNHERLLKVLCKTCPRDLLIDIKQRRSENGNHGSVALHGAQELKERYNRSSRIHRLKPWARALAELAGTSEE